MGPDLKAIRRPVTLNEARAMVREHHSHHAPHRAHIVAIGLELHSELVAVVIVERPKAQALCNGLTLEVSRLCVGPKAEPSSASHLLGAAWRTMAGMGIRRGISYTRVDEDGTCYRAAGWVSTALVPGREWTGGNKALRWLPGMYEPSTEIVDRVRWEIGPDAAKTRVRRGADGTWARCDSRERIGRNGIP